MLQTGVIAAMVLHYSGAPQQALLFLASVVAVSATLCSGAVPLKFLLILQAGNIPIVFIAKVRNTISLEYFILALRNITIYNEDDEKGK